MLEVVSLFSNCVAREIMNMPVKVKSNYEPEIKSNLSETSDFEFGVNSTTSSLLYMSISNTSKTQTNIKSKEILSNVKSLTTQQSPTSSSSVSPSSQLTIALAAENPPTSMTIPTSRKILSTATSIRSSLETSQLRALAEKNSEDAIKTLAISKTITNTTAKDITMQTTKSSCLQQSSSENQLSQLKSSASSSSVTIVTNSREQIDSSNKTNVIVGLKATKDIPNSLNCKRENDNLYCLEKTNEDVTSDDLETDLVKSLNEINGNDEKVDDSFVANGSDRINQTEEPWIVGCHHYKRHCLFVTPCCDKFYKCRFCHDENEDHHFDRKTLTELICSECDTRQRVQETCENCGVRFGKYTCLICNLFDDDDKSQYHCYGCGICRIGGRKNFFHCEVCNMCLPIQLKIEGHRCVENISRSNCPVCLGDIHTSRIPCHIPDCGHLLHKMCFDQLLASGHYVCPTCQTSIIDMTKMWEYLDAQALMMPIPKIYENRCVNIFCNDCHKTSTVKFHFIGLKCFYCGGYNTTQDVKRRRSWANVPDNASSA